jgi:2-succinyl-6-hydroxy-2,4-cyclohexadiene-1-carboxylate synthase
VRIRLIHGFTQTATSWNPVEARLPREWDVQALEVPDGLDFVATSEAIGHRGGGNGTWVGYSMGARLCLRLALDRPDTVQRLVLVSGTAGIRSAADRRARRASDEQLARDVERDGVEAFLERWLEQRLFETLPRELSMLDDRRRGNTVHRLVHQLRELGQGAQEPVWDRLGTLEMPVLLASGQWDRTYTEIADQMAAAIGDNATRVTIPKAGHSVNLERPDELAHELAAWLEGDATA